MIITKYHVSCDICHVATLEIKSMMVHNAVKEIAESGWKSIRPKALFTDIEVNPYLATHTCPECQSEADHKDHERRDER